jgi:hypothetical protein
MRKVIAALAACAVCVRVSAQIHTFEDGYWPAIRVASQEPSGPIHAAGSGEDWGQWNLNEDWQPGGNSPWNPWGSGDTATGIPYSMETARDGSAISVWTRKGDGSVFIFTQHGNIGYNPKLSGIAGPAALARVLMDSQSNLWVTETGLNIRKSASYGNLTLVHTITPDELWPGGSATNRLPVSMVQDAHGRIWFWSSCLSGDDSRGAICGVLIDENGAVTNRHALDGVPAGRISVVAPLDGATLWLAVRGTGIFSINPDTLAGVQEPEPETNAFRFVQSIFSAGKDRYVIAGDRADFNRDGLLSVLWRWRDGRWTKVIDGLDSEASPEQLAARQWTVTKEGLWLGAFGMGGWFVPTNDDPAQVINWQKNSAYDTINRWFQLKGGQMMGLQFGRGAIIADPAVLEKNAARPVSAVVIHTSRPLIQTADGRVFGSLRGRQSVLCEWEGTGWHEYPVPKNFQPDTRYETPVDSLNRVWWVPLTDDVSGFFIFDPARQRFEQPSGSFSELQNLRINTALRPPAPNPVFFGSNTLSPVPPAGAGIDSTATDRMGRHWLTAGGQLYRSAFGLTRACFPTNEPQPFADGRKLTAVLADNSGNAFVRTTLRGRDEYVLVPAREPLPLATVELVENDDDGVVIQLGANVPSPLFSCRLDDAPGDKPATNQTLRLDELSAGRHRVRIIALDQALQVSTNAAEVSFEVLLAPMQRIPKWIALLGDKDYARREAAVRGLGHLAKIALPALREARESETNPDRRWWLDAAIQQCEP